MRGVRRSEVDRESCDALSHSLDLTVAIAISMISQSCILSETLEPQADVHTVTLDLIDSGSADVVHH